VAHNDVYGKTGNRVNGADGGPSTPPAMTTNPSTDPERILPELDLDAHLDDPAIKQRFVTAMFEVIAARYDRFTRVFSYGMDRGWKRRLIDALDHRGTDARIVDLACGTGDLAFLAARASPGARVVGFDVARRMIQGAASRLQVGENRILFAVGDMSRLPLPDRSADVVTVGYGVRNAPTPRAALDEIARILEPGGTLLTLDFYRPANPIWRGLFLWYLRVAGSLVGWAWHRIPVAYGYIAPSVARHLTCDEFSRALEAAGFRVMRVQRRLFGGIALHAARRL